MNFSAIASELQVSENTVLALVPEGEGAFLPTGEPTIRFQRHLFSRFTHGRFDMKYPYLSNKRAGGYIDGASEHDKLKKARSLNHHAALRATSWGLFQVPGSGHVRAGYLQLPEFVHAMYRDEHSQGAVFVSFVKGYPRLHEALRTRNWAAAARLYNECDLPRQALLTQ